MEITVSKVLEKDIINFIRINEIGDINLFLSNCLRDGFNIAKYGYSPQDNFNKENKPFKLENNEHTEKEINTERVEEKETKRRGRPKKQPTETKESIIHKEEKIEPIKEIEIVKPKKKITIIKK